MYNKVDTTLNFCDRENQIIDFWKQNDVFKLSVKKNEGKEQFAFYDGPPTANGKPHIGHILTRVIKDIIPRYRTMKGYNVLRKAGWDTHGLPVELEVEKALGMDGKQDIEKYGIEPFIRKCKESVWKYKGEWERMSDRVGYWADMENPYITYDDNYIESVWWSIKEIDKQGLLYKGHKIVPYCPRCGTALSSHEVAQGYKDVEEKTIFVKFRLKKDPRAFFLAWTTTPWTLPSNVSLCMNPKETYV
ncbi:MAG: isoleucine--tRNA ligase, partial [Clostridia bacterium]|nr:isoleucine--tRNA ligase [Clostridia bacterium]